MSHPILFYRDLSITFRQGEDTVRAVDRVSLDVQPGEIVALVGESGSGKSVTALAALGLLPESAKISGEIALDGVRMDTASDKQLQHARGNDAAIIFQEPLTALNPLHNVGKQIDEILRLHTALTSGEREARTLELLQQVGLEKLMTRLGAFPHQLSGGERQRVMIAMAMACRPKLLIADEPTTALDVTVQLQVLKLIKQLQAETGMAVLLITHDLTIVRKIADRVAVMQQGRVVECQPTKDLFAAPKDDYTKALLAAEPQGEPLPFDASAPTIMQAEQLRVAFPRKKSWHGKVTEWFEAVQPLDLTIAKGQTLGIVGESGSGKTTLAMALLRLGVGEGRIIYAGERLDEKNLKAMRPFRDELQVVFQDPFGSLNPRMSVQQIIGEGLRVHEPKLTRMQRRAKVRQALEEVGLEASMLDRYPHEFSGGQRQRIAIARAMVLRPEILVLDEPTSALDLSVQAQVVQLLKDLQAKHGLTYLFISHDLRVVKALSHQLIVMKGGVVLERGISAEIFANPQHIYTQTLLEAAFSHSLAA